MTRRGFSLLEVIVASVLLGALMTTCLQLLHLTAAHHRATESRQLAIREADNVMQRLAAARFDDLTPEAARQIQLSEEASRGLPGAKLAVEVRDVPDRSDARRIVVRIEWQDRTGRSVRPVELVAWRYSIGPMSQEDPI